MKEVLYCLWVGCEARDDSLEARMETIITKTFGTLGRQKTRRLPMYRRQHVLHQPIGSEKDIRRLALAAIVIVGLHDNCKNDNRAACIWAFGLNLR